MFLKGLLACAITEEDYGRLLDYLATLLVPDFGVLSLLGDFFGGWMRLRPDGLDVFADLFEG